MRFPHAERLALPARFDQYVPGALHADGRRYLPQIVLSIGAHTLSVVDRHHYVDADQVGQTGTAALVCLLSTLHLQASGEQRQGFGTGTETTRVSHMPTLCGQVGAVLSWELRHGHLPYEALFTELLLDIGVGVVGVRTSVTAPSIAAAIGTEQVRAGDWLRVDRSRIDILGFRPDEPERV